MHMNKLFKIYSFLFIVLMASLAYGVPPSLTTVTATLTDSAGQVWINGTWRTELVPPFGNPNKPVNNGNPTVAPQTGAMDGSGAISVVLDDNLVVTPGLTKTKFTLCPNASVSTCTSVIVTVTGVSQNLTALLSAALVPVTVAASPTLTRAYNTTEVTGGLGAQFVNVTDGLVYQCTLSFCVGLGWTSAAGLSNATAIQGNPVSPGAITTPGQFYAVNNTATALELRSEFFVDAVASCGLPINQTDAWPKMKTCMVANPGKIFTFKKLVNGAGLCDYNFSQSLWFIGTGQSFMGRSNGSFNQGGVQLCWTTPGVPGVIAINQTASAATIQGLYLKGAENWTRTSLSTFVAPHQFGYPGLPWITGVTSAAGSTITVNGTNEAWTNQTDNQVVEVYGAGAPAPEGSISVATTANNFTVTCSCTTSMIGETLAVPGAGVAGATLYTRIVSIVNANNAATVGNAYVDVAPSLTVGSVTSPLTMNYFGTISSHSSASVANVTPAITTAVSGATVYVGSRADGFDCAAVGCQSIGSSYNSWGRDGIRVQEGAFGIGTGVASQIADSTWFLQNLIQSNRGNGFYCQSGNCQVGHYQGGTISANQYWAIDDTGFLGDSYGDINTATNHNDCSILPCPSIGGASGGAVNNTATWLEGIPYATATAPVIFVTDGTCTNGSNVIITTATGKFKAGHADAVKGSILKAVNCGPGGSTDLVTYITGFTNANSVTVNDNATCGGSCPGAGTVSLQTYQTINTTSGTAFASSHLTHSVLLSTAGPDGQALITTMAIFYSTTKVGLNAGAKNASISPQPMHFGTSDYQGELGWYNAWNFPSASITTGTTTLTTANANDVFLTGMCNVLPSTRNVVTVKGGGPGGTDHVTTCGVYTNAHSITLNDAVATTVSGGTAQVGTDGGIYRIAGANAPSVLIDGYGEVDQYLHGSKFGPVTRTLGGLTVVPPAVTGASSFSPINTYMTFLNPALGNWSDAGGTINLFAGRNVEQQVDLTWCKLITAAGVCNKAFRITKTSGNIMQVYVNELLAFNFAAGALRDYKADTNITSGVSHRFTCNSDGRQCFAINADGSLLWGCSAASTNCTKFANLPNTATRTITFPDASGTVALVSGATSWQGCNGKGLGDGFNAIPAQTYPQFSCVNNTGFTITLTGVRCWTDNVGTSTLNATNNAGTGLLTGAVTCNATKASGGAAGTQSATTTLANGDAISFTFVADGTSKQTNWTITGTY